MVVSPSPEDLLVVGAGQAALELIHRVRKNGFSGSVRLLGAESHLPYGRPPLSKEFLAGEMTVDRLALTTAAALDRLDVQVDLNSPIDQVDRVGRRVAGRSRTWAYRRLVWATGARPALPPWATVVHHHTVRGIEDSQDLVSCVRPGTAVAVLGAGFLGLEIAATLTKRGVDVTVFEAADTLLSGRASPAMAAHLLHTHQSHGVRLCFRSAVSAAEPTPQGGVVLRVDDADLRFDDLVIAVGAVSNTEPLAAAGVRCGRGVLVNEIQQTSDESIYAIGDVTSPAPGTQALPRWESVQGAKAQATRLAAVLTEQAVPPAAPASFWSRQFDSYLRIAGEVPMTDGVSWERTETAEGFVVRHELDGTLVALESVNSPAEHIAAMREIAGQHRLAQQEGSRG